MLGIHRRCRYRHQKRIQQRSGSSGSHRDRPPGLLRARIRSGATTSGHRPWQLGRHAPSGRIGMFLLSWQDMSLLPQQKAPSALPRTPTAPGRSPFGLSSTDLGKDAAYIISSINGFTYCQTQYDYETGELKVVREVRFSESDRGQIKCYGADDVREGVAIMHYENVGISITGNSTNPVQIPAPGGRHLQKGVHPDGQEIFLCGLRRRHGTDATPG
jgi:hypothetical protein